MLHLVKHLGRAKHLNKTSRKVLEALFVNGHLNFNAVQRKTRISPRILRDILDEAKANVLVQEADAGQWKAGKKLTYSITNKGKRILQQELILDKTAWAPLERTEINVKQAIMETLNQGKDFEGYKDSKSIYELSPLGKVPVQVFLWLLSGKNELKKREILEYLKSELSLEDLAFRFVEHFKNAIIETAKARYKWGGWQSDPLLMKELVKQERVALDFNGMLLLHFDGRKIVEQIDWEEELAQYDEHDRLMKEGYDRFKEAVSKSGPEQQNWIIDTAIDHIRNTETNELPTFLAKSLSASFSEIGDIVKDPWNVLNSSSKLKETLVQRLTSHISITKGFDHVQQSFSPPSKDEKKEAEVEVRRTIEEMLKDGTISIEPIFLFRLNRDKANRVQWKAREGYPSPVASFTAQAFGLNSDHSGKANDG